MRAGGKESTPIVRRADGTGTATVVLWKNGGPSAGYMNTRESEVSISSSRIASVRPFIKRDSAPNCNGDLYRAALNESAGILDGKLRN